MILSIRIFLKDSLYKASRSEDPASRSQPAESIGPATAWEKNKQQYVLQNQQRFVIMFWRQTSIYNIKTQAQIRNVP